MEFISYLIDLFLNLDKHLQELIVQYGTLTYLILFLVIFAETGFVVTPFLPGDSLLFAIGTFAALGGFDLTLIIILLSAGGILEMLSIENWDTSLDLNLRAPFLLAQQASEKMPVGSLIVNITDVGAQKTWSRYPSYTVSKAALESLTPILARALAPEIRVNAIAPGFVLQSDIVPAEEWERLIKRIPLRRPATTEEIASALEFLLAERVYNRPDHRCRWWVFFDMTKDPKRMSEN